MQKFGVASKADVSAAASTAGCVWLDVRSEGEVADDPIGAPFVHLPVTMSDVSALEAGAEAALPNKSATILCFCGVGGRVMGAKAALEAKGYTAVLNVGGLKDVRDLAAQSGGGMSRTHTLSSGLPIPVLGLGTFQATAPGEVKAAVIAAVRSGYRLIDCAAGYGNQKEVGAASDSLAWG